MPRGGPRPNSGGARPGAGRPKKVGVPFGPPPPADMRSEAAAEGMSPLDYMLWVMRDPTADPSRRDRMAIAAAPYAHVKPTEAAPGTVS